MMQVKDVSRLSRTQYLAGFKGDPYKAANRWAAPSEATFDGTVADLVAVYPDDVLLHRTLFNDVKICPKCGKPCALSLIVCSACSTSLENVAVSQSENQFTAFLFGVKAAQSGVPYTFSLRRETDKVLVFDDMLGLTPCHLNCISTQFYIPDWRYLLTDPPRALLLLDTMEDELWTATVDFLDYGGILHHTGVSRETIRSKVIKSFNYPPSHYQLHVHWLVPPLLPFHHHMAAQSKHFHEGRTFPLAYVREVLSLNEPYHVEKDTRIEDIVAFYDQQGVSYEKMWAEFYRKTIEDSLECANWELTDFEYVVEDSTLHRFSINRRGIVQTGEALQGLDLAQVRKADCTALQNYGRPYKDGLPTGTYIKNALKPLVGPGGYEEWPGVFRQLSLDAPCLTNRSPFPCLTSGSPFTIEVRSDGIRASRTICQCVLWCVRSCML